MLTDRVSALNKNDNIPEVGTRGVALAAALENSQVEMQFMGEWQ